MCISRPDEPARAIPNQAARTERRSLLDTAASTGLSAGDRKRTRLNSSHQISSYAVFCLKKKIDERRRDYSGGRTHWRARQQKRAGGNKYLAGPESKRPYFDSCHTRPADRGAFLFNDTATTEIYTLSLHDALPI